MYTEKEAWFIHGILGIVIEVILLFLFILNIFHNEKIFAYIFLIIFLIILTGFTNNSMYEAKRVLFFGQYIGTLRKQGLVVTVPFSNRKKVSLQITSYEVTLLFTEKGTDYQFKIVVFYRVVDTAKANLPKIEIENIIKLYSEVIIRSLFVQQNNYQTELNELNETFIITLNEKLKPFGIEAIETYVYHS